MSTSPNQIQLTPSPNLASADPNRSNLLQDLAAALKGGDPVYDFFSGNYQALQQFFTTIATGDDTIWLDGTDQETGNPVQYIQLGSNYLTISAYLNDDAHDTLANGTGSTDNYTPVGTAVVTMTTSAGTGQLTVHIINYAGYGIGGALLTGAVVSAFISSCVTTLKNFLQTLFQKIASFGDTEILDTAYGAMTQSEYDAAVAAEWKGFELSAGAAETTTDAGISVGAGVAAAVGVVIIGIMVLIQLLEKQMNNYVRFYNVTAEDIQFGIGTVPSGGSTTGPAQVGQTATVPQVSPSSTPSYITGSDTSVYYSVLQFINTNPLGDIGYVLEATPNGDFPGFRVAVYVPNTGDNYMYVGFTSDDCNTVWTDLINNYTSDNPSEPYVGTSSLTMSATSGKYTLSIATNQVSGQSPDPSSGAKGYNYEHLIVLTDGSFSLPS
jgi:hypothetical protein